MVTLVVLVVLVVPVVLVVFVQTVVLASWEGGVGSGAGGVPTIAPSRSVAVELACGNQPSQSERGPSGALLF